MGHSPPFRGSTCLLCCSKFQSPQPTSSAEQQATCRFQAPLPPESGGLTVGQGSLTETEESPESLTSLVLHWFLYPSIPTFLSTHCVPGTTQGEEGVKDSVLSPQAHSVRVHDALQAEQNLGQTTYADELSLQSSRPLDLGIVYLLWPVVGAPVVKQSCQEPGDEWNPWKIPEQQLHTSLILGFKQQK